MTSYLRRFLHEYGKVTPADWGMRMARGLVSGIPLVGGIAAEGIGPAVDAARATADAEQPSNREGRELEDTVLATGAFGLDFTMKHSRNVSAISDDGVGLHTVVLAENANDADYIVLAQAPGAIVDVPFQSASSFALTIRDRQDPTRMVDAPVKFVVLRA